MALDNKTVLENLVNQRTELITQIESSRTTVLRLDGAIDVLQQLIESAEKTEETEETEEVAETEVVAENE
jgi:hypothetical protein|tara:strand:+ start:156 stop:365 length:210 start_codon:yes stop_codon:yes gene_type:complete